MVIISPLKIRGLRGVMKRSLGKERRIKAVGGWVELKESGCQ